MEILQIVGVALIVTVLTVLLRQQRPELAVQVSIAFGVLVFIMMLGKIAAVVDVLTELTQRANVNVFYMTIIFKIIGVAYIAEFGAQVCRDAGEGAVAGKIEFAGKVLVMVMAIPIIALVLETIVRLVP